MRGRGRGGWRRISGDDDDEEEEHKSSSGDGDSDESEEAIRLEMEENEQDEDEDEDENENEEEEEEEEIEYAEEENSENDTQQQHQEQGGFVDADGVDQEEEEEGEGEEEEEGENYEQPDPPKLDEGFFEIEDVRRKRVRKGQTLYFIKWRGWPETANTWEPIENLQACCDVVEAFEKSLRPGSRGRKRKRRGSFSQPKKTQQHTPSSNVSGSKQGRKPRSLTSPSIDSSRPSTRVASKSVYGESKGNEKNEGGSKNEDDNNVDTTAQQTENENGSFTGYELRERTSTDNINSESRKVSIHFSHMRTSDMVEGHSVGLPKVDFDENTQSNRFTGAKRRKSGNVKRFKKEDAQNGLENGEGSTWDDQQKVGRLSNPCSITKIMKPIGYSASISNDVQDVCVTFVAMSSDGREVVVDNKQLKADNPQLLISFYEQHLRYSPPA